MDLDRASSSSADESISSTFSDFSESSCFEEATGEESLQENFKSLQPFLYEPEADNRNKTPDSYGSDNEWENIDRECRVGHLTWCHCGNCREEGREIDCLCCQELDALNEKDIQDCVINNEDFKVLCLNRNVLCNVLYGLHESKGDALDTEFLNRSLRFATYKQFTWWAHRRLGKGRRRVIPSCVLWTTRNQFPEESGVYVLYDGGKD